MVGREEDDKEREKWNDYQKETTIECVVDEGKGKTQLAPLYSQEKEEKEKDVPDC